MSSDICASRICVIRSRLMAKVEPKEQDSGAWVIRDIPRETMHRTKVAAAIERKRMKQFLLDLVEAHLQEMEKKGLLPKGK
jgi:hypothetical protein